MQNRSRESQIIPQKIGILGGLGPFATMPLIETILNETKRKGAVRDQDFPDMTIEMACSTPDRTVFLKGKSDNDPAPVLISAMHRLEAAGCRVIGMACNTAHGFWSELAAAASPNTQLVHIVDATVKKLLELQAKSVLLLATDSTIELDLYAGVRAAGMALITPRLGSELQNEVMSIIFGSNGLKAGFKGQDLTRRIIEVITQFPQIDAIISGCTELPLILHPDDVPGLTLVNPVVALAEEIVAASSRPL
ncbi:amino acid racemase [bacterium]|nr:amino acid racemase [bacterium]